MSATRIPTPPGPGPRPARASSLLRKLSCLAALLALAGLSLGLAKPAKPQGNPRLAHDPFLVEAVPVPGGSQPNPVLPPAPTQCPSHTITAGKADHFQTGNVEPANPSATLKGLLSTSTLVDFDDPNSNRGFAHTFQLPRCGCIVGAKLELRAKAHADIPSNDSLNLGFSNQAGFPRWVSYFGTGNAPTIPTLTQSGWSSGTVADITLDLANLPPGGGPPSLLSALQTHRYLDFYVQDDTTIDYVKLTYTLCNCTTCPRTYKQ